MGFLAVSELANGRGSGTRNGNGVEGRAYNHDIEVLCVCTGNVCRSPMLEVMLGAALRDRGVDAWVRSAGVWEAGHPASQYSVLEAADRGFDLGSHRSRVIDAPMIEGADLILALARQHVVEVAGLVPGVFGRTYTLKEIVRRGREVGPRSPGESLPDWLAEIGRDRVAATYLRAGPADDVDDPIGGSRAQYARTAVELESLATALAELLQPRPTVSVPSEAFRVPDRS